MTYDQFEEKYRGHFFALIAEAWATRKTPPSEAGAAFDHHYTKMRDMLRQMWNDVHKTEVLPEPPPVLASLAKKLNGQTNGHANGHALPKQPSRGLPPS